MLLKLPNGCCVSALDTAPIGVIATTKDASSVKSASPVVSVEGSSEQGVMYARAQQNVSISDHLFLQFVSVAKVHKFEIVSTCSAGPRFTSAKIRTFPSVSVLDVSASEGLKILLLFYEE